MSTEKVTTQLPGETFVATEPSLRQQVDPGWRHRMSLFTGRTLTDLALSAEQDYRAGRMALLAQLVTYGVASGLNAAVDADGVIHVSAGYGFTANGEDVTLPRDLKTSFIPAEVGMEPLLVIDAVTGSPIKTFVDLKNDPAVKGGVFVLLLQPVTGKVTGDTINTVQLPVEVCGDLSCSCTRDPELYAFEDWELVDGSRLVLARWPEQPDFLKLPDPNPAATWRNRVAYTVFSAQLALGPDAYLPWEGIGVALAVIAFDAAWKIQFFDQNTVVRSGGHARKFQLLNPALAMGGEFVQASRAVSEARLLQLLEQTAQIQGQTDLTSFINLPPTGILPAASVDLMKHSNLWFPKNWNLHVGPIHTEEVETALRSQIFGAPFDLTQPDDVDLLLPLSDDAYDLNVLVVESLAQVFKDELTKATEARNLVLQHRKFLQTEANVLLKVEGEKPIDLDAELTDDEKKGRDDAPYSPPADGSEAYGTSKAGDNTASTDLASLKQKAGASPYTVKIRDKTVSLISDADWTYLDSNGLQAFIDRINARLDKVDDLLNLHFLQTQTNIYRYRTNVLTASAASRLVTSPIIANIAERESAVATAQDLQAYIGSIAKTPAAAPVVTAPAAPAAPLNLRMSSVNLFAASLGTRIGGLAGATTLTTGTTVKPVTASGIASIVGTRTTAVPALSATFAGSIPAAQRAITQLPSNADLPSQGDVTSQLPLTGVPFNLRTLSVAERLKTSPSHEALLYAASSRLSLLEQLLAEDLGMTVDDLEVLVQEEDPHTPGKFTLVPRPILQLRDATLKASIYGNIQKAGLADNSDESGVFSAGISALDHHSLLLRAVEARVALYRQFAALAAKTLDSIQSSLNGVMAAIHKVTTGLSDARHNLALVMALISDENQRIGALNTRRAQVLANVPFIVFMRRRTLAMESDVPSRQLVPANVASPVPEALTSTAIIPPELGELANLLREAPPAWIPALEDLLSSLKRPQHFTALAVSTQIRAYTKTQVPLAQSSATSHPGPFGLPIADIFTSQQNSLMHLVQQRASYQPAQMATMTWAEQKREIFNVSGINDLISSEFVHLELASKITQLIQHVSKVATALYLRVSATLPAERLAWAEFLLGPGRWINLRSLSVLPGWNTQDYIDRQQMQMLVDWLFAQIDLTINDAVSYMSDLVRTAILLASHAPVNDVIAGEVAARTKPAVGGIVPLTLPSTRVAHGMPVLLYQAGELTARAVVDDLDSQQVYAKVTTIYKENTYLEAQAQAHFLNDDPQSAMLTKASLVSKKRV
jgi:hypothetical protein